MTEFKPRVAFDTFDNKLATDFSLTLSSKHPEYRYSRLSRTFLCGVDDNPYSKTAIQWLFEEFVEDGDEVVCLRVIDPSSKLSTSDSQLEEKKYRDEAQAFMDRILKVNTADKKVSFILEFSVGKVQPMIQRMIQIYEPSVLIVGTRGSRSSFQGLLPGSVSKYCLQHSPVPVVVVQPSQVREEKRQKRAERLLEKPPVREVDYTTKVSNSGAMGKLMEPDLPAYLKVPNGAFDAGDSRAASPALDETQRGRSKENVVS